MTDFAHELNGQRQLVYSKLLTFEYIATNKIAKQTNLSKGTVSSLLTGLRRDGYIQSRNCEGSLQMKHMKLIDKAKPELPVKKLNGGSKAPIKISDNLEVLHGRIEKKMSELLHLQNQFMAQAKKMGKISDSMMNMKLGDLLKK